MLLEIVIKRCFKCNNLIKVNEPISGNTFGAKYWTDGKVEGPMLFNYQLIGKCPHCKSFLWVYELEVYKDKIDIEDDIPNFLKIKPETEAPYNYQDIPYIITGSYRGDFDLETWYEILNLFKKDEIYPRSVDFKPIYKIKRFVLILTNKEKEIYIRKKIWWAYNDKRRYKKDEKIPYTKKEKENLEELNKLIDIDSEEIRILKAEILRELGKFEEAEKILDYKFSEDYKKTAKFIKKLIKQRDKYVKEIK